MLFSFAFSKAWTLHVPENTHTHTYSIRYIYIYILNLVYLTDPVCQRPRLWFVGSDSKSTKYFTSFCKQWNVYFQGYMCCAACPPEDESSTGYIRYVWGGLWTSSWRSSSPPGRGGDEKHCWAITAVLTFCHIASQQEKETVNLSPHPPPTVNSIDTERWATKPIV